MERAEDLFERITSGKSSFWSWLSKIQIRIAVYLGLILVNHKKKRVLFGFDRS